MQYIKFTYVDSTTGAPVTSAPVTSAPAVNGPAFPAVAGLEFAWARESSYPTNIPEFFGTCPDDSDTDVPGVLGVYLQADWESMRADEMRARNPIPASVTRAQGKAALITAGLWAGVLDFVAAIPDPTERTLAEVALHDTQAWRRQSAFFGAAKDALGLTEEQLDGLFLAASKIEL